MMTRNSTTRAEVAANKERQMAVWRVEHRRKVLASEREAALAPLAAELAAAERNESKSQSRLDDARSQADAVRQRYRETEAGFTARAEELRAEALILGMEN